MTTAEQLVDADGRAGNFEGRVKKEKTNLQKLIITYIIIIIVKNKFRPCEVLTRGQTPYWTS